MNHLTAQEIDRLYKQQQAALSGISKMFNDIQQFDKKTTRNFQPMTADGQEYTKAVRDERKVKTDMIKDAVSVMRRRVEQAKGTRRNWTRDGYMAAYRFVNDVEDSLLSNGKTLASIQDELVRSRLMAEAKLYDGHELARQADAAASAGDWGSLRIFGLEAGSRSDNKSRDAVQKIKQLLNEVELPSDQQESFDKLDQIELLAENAQKIYFDVIGIKASHLRGEVPKTQQVVKANPPSAA